MEKHLITRISIFNIQVCSAGTIDEALEYVKIYSPAGTSNNWMISDKEENLPCQCDKFKDRKHYLFAC